MGGEKRHQRRLGRIEMAGRRRTWPNPTVGKGHVWRGVSGEGVSFALNDVDDVEPPQPPQIYNHLHNSRKAQQAAVQWTQLCPSFHLMNLQRVTRRTRRPLLSPQSIVSQKLSSNRYSPSDSHQPILPTTRLCARTGCTWSPPSSVSYRPFAVPGAR